MPKQLVLSALIELPDNTFDAAGVTFKLSGPWLALLAEMDNAGIKYQAKVDELEVRAKLGRPRKTREKPPTLDDVRGILREQGEAA
jgi:hypothetical protein